MVALAERVLCVVAHPDDEVLGCGATLAKAADLGAEVRVLLAVRRTDPRGLANWDTIVDQFRAASRVLGADAVVCPVLMSEEETETDIKRLHELVVEHVEWARLVITHWPGDVHQVHRQVSRAVEIATRPFRRRRDVLFMEVPTSTDQAFAAGFSPSLYVEVDERQVARKLDAMRLYLTEHDPGRRPDDLELQLRYRGTQIGVDHAEAFAVARAFI